MSPVPLTNYTDAQIRSEVIGTGGSVPASDYTFMDLVNASDFSRFDPTYLAGASNKDGLVNSDQFRHYPITVSCPIPSLSVSYFDYNNTNNYLFYTLVIDNMISGLGYDVIINNESGFDGGYSLDTGSGSFIVYKDMRSVLMVNVRFHAHGSCPLSHWGFLAISPNQYLPSAYPVPTAPFISSNGQCVSGSTSARLTGSGPVGSTLVWSDGQTGSPILADYAGVWRAWSRNSNGYSLASNSVNVYNC